MATRYLQQRQQQQLQDGSEAAAAAAAAAMRAAAERQVLPSEFINDGYIWLAVAHHLLGAGETGKVSMITLQNYDQGHFRVQGKEQV